MWAPRKRTNRSRCRLGPNSCRTQWHGECTLKPRGKYEWTIRVRRLCGLMSNYFDHSLKFVHHKLSSIRLVGLHVNRIIVASLSNDRRLTQHWAARLILSHLHTRFGPILFLFQLFYVIFWWLPHKFFISVYWQSASSVNKCNWNVFSRVIWRGSHVERHLVCPKVETLHPLAA